MLRLFSWMLGLVPAAVLAAPAFDRDVAPILRTYCAGCHHDREAESGFSVERYATLRRGGDGSGDPIVAGDAAGSVLIRRIRSGDADHMPPADEPQVPAAELATLEAWIVAGAPGPTEDVSILESLAVPPLAPYAGAKPVTALAVSPDGARLAVGRGRSVEIVALKDGRPEDSPPVAVPDLPGRVTALHFSRDGSRLVLAAGIPGLRGVAEIRDATTGALLRSFAGHCDLLSDAELAPPDEALLATAGYDRSIKLWNVADAAVARSIDVHNAAILDLAWHPSGTVLASASADETVKLWRQSDGVRLDTLSQPQGDVTSVAFTPDGEHVVAAGRDKRIHLWRLVSRAEPAINPALHARFAHEAPIVALALSTDGRELVTAAEDRSLKAWSLPGLELVNDAPRQSDVVAVVAPLAARRFLLGRMDGSLDRLDLGADGAVAAVGGRSPASMPTAGSAARPDVGSAAAAETEAEPNDAATTAQPVPVPATVSGAIQASADADCFRFTAQANSPLVVEVTAASRTPASRLDSRLEILDSRGRPVEQVVLQAVRDSWLTFLGKNSTQFDDFRLHNWEEMELDEYVYAGGEVVRLWLYPRGPDSGFMVYPGMGERHAFFHTTPVAHPLGEPAWVVEPLPRGATPVPNGLPVFRIAYENDDESTHRLGTDSHILFNPPDDGEYVARVTDVRGFGGPTDFHYALAVRPPRPNFVVRIDGTNPQVSPGSGRELSFQVTRSEGFTGPVRIEIDGLPAGFRFHGPIEIEAGQQRARGVMSAAADAAAPDGAADAAVRVRAVAEIGGREVVQELGTLGDIGLGEPPKFTVEIAAPAVAAADPAPGEPRVFRIRPGETVAAVARVQRLGFTDRIDFGGNEQADRNLPHGVIVDNLGLNGLLIVEGEHEREFVLRAAPKARPGRRLFHLLAVPDGGQASMPAVIEVVADGPAASAE